MLKVAVITGGHHFDVVAFYQMWRALPEIDAYPQHMADFVASAPEVQAQYDVLLFYTHLRDEITNLGSAPGHNNTFHSTLASLGSTPQGIVVLHHGLVAFPQWEVWSEVIGLTEHVLQEYAHDEAIHYHVADPTHPICAGLTDWTMIDETYLMADAGGDSHILITTDHPRCVTTLAWTRQHKLSRVFCLQSGHDQQTWDDAHFRQLLQQGITWCAATGD